MKAWTARGYGVPGEGRWPQGSASDKWCPGRGLGGVAGLGSRLGLRLRRTDCPWPPQPGGVADLGGRFCEAAGVRSFVKTVALIKTVNPCPRKYESFVYLYIQLSRGGLSSGKAALPWVCIALRKFLSTGFATELSSPLDSFMPLRIILYRADNSGLKQRHGELHLKIFLMRTSLRDGCEGIRSKARKPGSL